MVVLTDKQKILLDDYNDLCFVYSILCLRTCNFYSKLKVIIDIPIIILSASLSIINSNFRDCDPIIKIVNIICNVVIVTLFATNNLFKINEKKTNFKILHDKFTKLSHKIEEKKILNKIDAEFISSVILQYESITETIEHDFPDKIKRQVREEYKTQRTLPPIINHIKKLMENRDIELLGITSSSNTGNNSPTERERIGMRPNIQYQDILSTTEKKNVSFENYFIDKSTSNPGSPLRSVKERDDVSC